MTISIDAGTLIGVLSTAIALVSLGFAWRAVKVAERSTSAGMYTELHKIYQSPNTFSAIRTVWGLYDRFEGCETGELISDQEALELVSTIDRDSTEWNAIHDMSLFWKYASVLVRKKHLDREIAFESFTSPRMLGFLAPVEQAFLEHHYGKRENADRLPLSWLYTCWQRYAREKGLV